MNDIHLCESFELPQRYQKKLDLRIGLFSSFLTQLLHLLSQVQKGVEL